MFHAMPPRHRPFAVFALATLLAAGTAVVAAACSGAAGARSYPGSGPTVAGRHSVRALRGDLSSARLDLVSGTDVVTVTGADLGDRLFEAETLDGAPQQPHAVDHDGQVDVSLSDIAGSGTRSVVITLSSAVSWTVSLDGGAKAEHVDLSEIRLNGLTFAGGASAISVVLPPPSGDVTVLMAGGASEYLTRVPAAVPVRVLFGGGAGSSIIDGAARSGIPGGTAVSGPGWEAAAKRYTFENSAGVSSFTMTRA